MEILISEEKGVRQLHFGSTWVQGAMRIAKPDALELEYTREMMLPLLFNMHQAWPRSALFIGLGVGALPKFLHKHRPGCAITVVEISPAVVGAAQMHFKLPATTATFQVEIGCGAAYLANSEKQYDLIMVDGFDEHAKVGPLNSSEFYLNCKARLTGQGYLVANLLSNQKDSEPGKQRFVAAFDSQTLVLPPCKSGNVVAVAHQGAGFGLDAAELNANARQLLDQTGLNLASTVAKLLQVAPHC
jgi:spermidine synthase